MALLIPSFYAVLATYGIAGVPGGLWIGTSYGFGRSLPVVAASVALLLGVRYELLGEWPRLQRQAFKRVCAGALLTAAVVVAVSQRA